MSERNQRFAELTWSDLIEALESMKHERAMQDAKMAFGEVTDLVQAQLFRDQPLLAIRAARVIEIRSAQPETVLYLRTGVPVESESATLEAGAFLLSVRILDGKEDECRYLRQPRVKRGENWRQNLRRRVRESLRGLEAGGTGQSLVEIMTPEQDDLEADLTPPRFPSAPPTRSERTTMVEPITDQPNGLGTSQWGELQAAGISLPVWMSAITSLALVLILLLSSPGS